MTSLRFLGPTHHFLPHHLPKYHSTHQAKIDKTYKKKTRKNVFLCALQREEFLHFPPNLVFKIILKAYYKVRQLAITKCGSSYFYKVRELVITKCDSYFVTNCDKCYYKGRQVLQSVTILLQSATGITKCVDYNKVRQNSDCSYFFSLSLKVS